MANRKVSCFGAPFYQAGGLTDDRLTIARRTRRRSIEEIVAAAYLRYARYFDPWTRKPVEPLAAVDALKFLRDRFAGNTRPVVFYRLAGWKRRPLAALLAGPTHPPVFTASYGEAERTAKQHGGVIAAWGRGAKSHLVPRSDRALYRYCRSRTASSAHQVSEPPSLPRSPTRSTKPASITIRRGRPTREPLILDRPHP